MWDNSKYRDYTVEQLLKKCRLWSSGLSGNVKESFEVGACAAMAGAVILGSAHFGCCQLFPDRLGASRAVLPPCAAPSGEERAGRERPAHSSGAAALYLPQAPRASGSIKPAIWCLRRRKRLCLERHRERQRSANPPRFGQVELGRWKSRE